MSQNPNIKTVDVIGLPVAVVDYRSAIDWVFEKARLADRAYAIEAANTHVAALARHEAEFGEVMQQFDLICPDGMPLVWAINRELRKHNERALSDRVYGPTLMVESIKASEGQEDLKHFFLGGSPSTLKKLEQRFSDEHPAAKIVGSYSPPFGEWSEDEFERIKDRIRESGANLVWVGLGCPKQERWIAKHKDVLPGGCYFGVGAAFAFHAGEVDQAPPIIQKYGLEWLYRLIKEPRRLWKRYFKYNSLFLYFYIRGIKLC
ncbi:WecB/TagA/CpsF family glycosyltransferase [Rubritalea tangerina]|uniref:WecB/TagA/CpsF family glycosyltransferase n=1 Tax=Rubritalea tangerina TaxID=430798 RepID=A0ABW4ZAF8_9BACT